MIGRLMISQSLIGTSLPLTKYSRIIGVVRTMIMLTLMTRPDLGAKGCIEVDGSKPRCSLLCTTRHQHISATVERRRQKLKDARVIAVIVPELNDRHRRQWTAVFPPCTVIVAVEAFHDGLVKVELASLAAEHSLFHLQMISGQHYACGVGGEGQRHQRLAFIYLDTHIRLALLTHTHARMDYCNSLPLLI